MEKETNNLKEIISIIKGELIYLKDDFNNKMNIIKENNNKFKEDNIVINNNIEILDELKLDK